MDQSFKPACPHPRDKCAPVKGKVCTYLCDECGVEFIRSRKQQDELPPPPDGLLMMDADQFAMAVQLLNMASTAFAPWREHMAKQGAQPEADILLAQAMASYAGTIYGQLVAMGCAKDSEADLWLDSLRANAERGIDAGKKQTARAMLAELDADQAKPS